ncbi:ABC transporter substrate-binding protein [Streptomyces sp. MS19]|uniref:ABC transporter substrate-binding protein n=1 Tax=Streptomyces sp. MS19 TaxID=3385972 RepID=UPI0039A02942
MSFPRAARSGEFPNPPRRGTRLLLLAVGVTVAVVAAFLVVWLPGRLDCGGADLTRRGDECLGVTDGSPAFLPTGDDELADRFREVQELIKAENDRVAEQGDAYVKVGLLATLTPDDTGPQAPRRVLHALEGAYTAQMRANQTRQLGDPAPQIQLHLANVGSRHEQWEPAVDRLVSMADDAEPLVAVVGLSISTDQSKAAAERLADHGIPVVASSASADGLNSATVPGLIRVTASNTDFVTALRQYVRDHEELNEAVLVYDENEPDLHVATLTEAFRALMADELGTNPAQPFQGTTVDRDAPAALFDAAVRNICQAAADMVLFAGRTGDLHAFVESLHSRACRDEPMALLFVETGPVVSVEEEARLAENNITIVQASAMDPAWARGFGPDADAPPGFRGFFEQYDTHITYVEDVPAALADGYAVANHDAMATAIRAVRVSHAQDPQSPMTSARVEDALFLLHLSNAVEAASGTLHFTTDRQGDPGGKPVPIIETPPGPTRPELYTTPVP